MDRKGIGSRLRTVRDHEGLTQQELAERIGCTRSFIAYVEIGRSAPSAGMLAGLERLGYSGFWLLTGQGSMKSACDPVPLSVRDGPCSSQSRPTITIELPRDVSAGDTILVRIDRRDHPLALIGKIIYTLPRK